MTSVFTRYTPSLRQPFEPMIPLTDLERATLGVLTSVDHCAVKDYYIIRHNGVAFCDNPISRMVYDLTNRHYVYADSVEHAIEWGLASAHPLGER